MKKFARKSVTQFNPTSVVINATKMMMAAGGNAYRARAAVMRAAKRFFSPAGSNTVIPNPDGTFWELVAYLYLEDNYKAFLEKSAGNADHEGNTWPKHPVWYLPFAGPGILYKTGELAAAFDPYNPAAKRVIKYNSRGFSIAIKVPYAEEHNTGAKVIYTGPGPRHGTDIQLQTRPLFINKLSNIYQKLVENKIKRGFTNEIVKELRKEFH